MVKPFLATALKTGVGMGIAANLIVIVSTLPFLFVPRTASVRAGG